MSLDFFVTYVLDLYIALRWALLAREDGNLNSEKIIRLILYTSRAGTEALESLSFCGRLHRLLSYQVFPL